jgi:large subunit ribosomal protein L27
MRSTSRGALMRSCFPFTAQALHIPAMSGMLIRYNYSTMASTKAGGSAKNLNTSNPKYLGVKLADGSKARPGMVIVRQRGTKIEAGKNVKVGRDHTLFAMIEGTVAFRSARKTAFTGKTKIKKVVDVI